MAVQQVRKSRARRDQRRSHDSLVLPATSINKETGETHRRHHLTENGYDWKGRQVVAAAIVDQD